MYKMSKNSEKRKYSRRQIKKKIFLSAFSEKKKKDGLTAQCSVLNKYKDLSSDPQHPGQKFWALLLSYVT